MFQPIDCNHIGSKPLSSQAQCTLDAIIKSALDDSILNGPILL